jgi:hypothetical protein
MKDMSVTEQRYQAVLAVLAVVAEGREVTDVAGVVPPPQVGGPHCEGSAPKS